MLDGLSKTTKIQSQTRTSCNSKNYCSIGSWVI